MGEPPAISASQFIRAEECHATVTEEMIESLYARLRIRRKVAYNQVEFMQSQLREQTIWFTIDACDLHLLPQMHRGRQQSMD
jgi:hypothetical protein